MKVAGNHECSGVSLLDVAAANDYYECMAIGTGTLPAAHISATLISA